MTGFDYDLFVIGAGSGGVRAARIAAGHGARVAVAEEYRVGGTCVIRGCVPKKLLVYASRFADEFEDAAGFGWSLGSSRFDWASLIAAKDKEIARLEAAYRATLAKYNVEVFAERATVLSANEVRLTKSDRVVSAKTILIATGGHPNVDPKLRGVEHVITSNEAFHLKELPRRIVVAGGGYIAVEFASIFNGLGSEVTLIYRGEKILRGFDEDLRDALTAAMARRGIRIITGHVFTGVDKTAGGIKGEITSGATLEAEQIMFAIGRSPNTAGLDSKSPGSSWMVQVPSSSMVNCSRRCRRSTRSAMSQIASTSHLSLSARARRSPIRSSATSLGGSTTRRSRQPSSLHRRSAPSDFQSTKREPGTAMWRSIRAASAQ